MDNKAKIALLTIIDVYGNVHTFEVIPSATANVRDIAMALEVAEPVQQMLERVPLP